MSDPVQPGRVAIVAGAIVALQVVVAFLIRPVPDRVVSLLGGPDGGVDRLGGLRIRYRPPAGVDTGKLESYLATRSKVRRDGDALILEFPAIGEAMASELVEILTNGGLTMREALETKSAGELIKYAPEGVKLDVDLWRSEDGGPPHTVTYLAAATRSQLERTVSEARTQGWQPAPGSEIAYERIDPRGDERDPSPRWRTYELATAISIDGTMIASAIGSYDPNTGRPVVMLELDRDGRDRFCELTRRISGTKLATVLGGRVRSAPIINGPICGGRASITMGGGDPRVQEAERDMLVTVLQQGPVPRGGTVESHDWHPAPSIGVTEWAGRLLLGLIVGGLFGLLVVVAIRFVRPHRRAAPARVEGKFPVRRLVVTLLGPLALFLGAKLTLPGINEFELRHIIVRSTGIVDGTPWSVLALGVMPILTSYAVVELIALAIPRLRWRRHDPRGRVRLDQAVAILAVLVALVQGYFAARYLESLTRGGAEIVDAPGLKFSLLTMLTLATGTMLLGMIAGMIRAHGLGNGYGVLFCSAALLKFIAPMIDEPMAIPYIFDRGMALGLVTLAAIVIATAHMLRWRIGGGEREAELRIPSSGVAPLSDGGGLVFVILTLSGLGLGVALWDVMVWVTELRARIWLVLVLVAMFVPIWAWLFSRPSLVERVAMPAGLLPPTRSSWARAMAASMLLIVSAAILHRFAIAADPHASVLADPALAMLGTAVVLDIIDEARAHRRKLAAAGVLHQIQHAGVVERVLADAGIPCHLHASNLRTLLAFFGPWAPVIVLVPEPHAAEARQKLDEVLRVATGKLPVARITTSAS
jgi:preprotein translocase subunit SecD